MPKAPAPPEHPSFDVRAALWLYQGEGAWTFVTLPKPLSQLIKSHFSPVRRGFGSIRVQVRVGSSVWKTSLFPTKEGAYVLPVKAAVRKAEGLVVGKKLDLNLEILV